MLFLIFQSCHIILSSFQLPPHLPPDLFISLYFCIFLYISILSYSSFPADVAPLSPSPRPYFFIYFIFFYIFFIFFNIIYIFFIFLFFIFFIFQINLVIFPLSSSPLTFPQTLSANKWTRALVAGNRASNIPKQPFCQTTLKQKSVKQGIKLNIPKNPGNLEQARKISLCQTT